MANGGDGEMSGEGKCGGDGGVSEGVVERVSCVSVLHVDWHCISIGLDRGESLVLVRRGCGRLGRVPLA